MRPYRLLACLLLGALALTSCAAHAERWAVLRFERLSYSNLYQQVADALDGSGYRVIKQDPGSGRIETDWDIGPSLREVRGPSRRKAVARINAVDHDDDGGTIYEVRVRVREQVIRKGGLLAHEIRSSEDWEDWKDNYDEAEYLLARLGALLQDYRVRLEHADPDAAGVGAP